jgi:hypothetical protein
MTRRVRASVHMSLDFRHTPAARTGIYTCEHSNE